MTERREYRVVVTREGQRPKVTRYATKRAAERRLRLVKSPEPWRVLFPDRAPDEPWCCDGYMCGCKGESAQEFAGRVRAELPALVSAVIQSRPVGAWCDDG